MPKGKIIMHITADGELRTGSPRVRPNGDWEYVGVDAAVLPKDMIWLKRFATVEPLTSFRMSPRLLGYA